VHRIYSFLQVRVRDETRRDGAASHLDRRRRKARGLCLPFRPAVSKSAPWCPSVSRLFSSSLIFIDASPLPHHRRRARILVSTRRSGRGPQACRPQLQTPGRPAAALARLRLTTATRQQHRYHGHVPTRLTVPWCFIAAYTERGHVDNNGCSQRPRQPAVPSKKDVSISCDTRRLSLACPPSGAAAVLSLFTICTAAADRGLQCRYHQVRCVLGHPSGFVSFRLTALTHAQSGSSALQTADVDGADEFPLSAEAVRHMTRHVVYVRLIDSDLRPRAWYGRGFASHAAQLAAQPSRLDGSNFENPGHSSWTLPRGAQDAPRIGVQAHSLKILSVVRC
jgi:hypothetical protein